eukprot:764236-Hanusia_phi.AAC.5
MGSLPGTWPGRTVPASNHALTTNRRRRQRNEAQMRGVWHEKGKSEMEGIERHGSEGSGMARGAAVTWRVFARSTRSHRRHPWRSHGLPIDHIPPRTK